jgi:capsular polysaccharide biosynthesis protein
MSFSKYITKGKIFLVEKIISLAKFLVSIDFPFTNSILTITNHITNITLWAYKLTYTSDMPESQVVLYPKTEAETAEPKHLNGNQNITSHQLPDIGFLRLKNAVLDPSSPVIRVGNKAVVESTLPETLKESVVYSGRHLHANGGKMVLFQEAEKKTIEKGIALSGSYEKNWYHLLIEILPKLEMVEKLDAQFQAYPLILPASLLELPNIQDLIERLTSNVEVVFMEKLFSYEVADCIFIESPVLAPPKTKGNLVRTPTSQHIRPEIIKSFRSKILNLFTPEELEPRPNEPTRIFLARGEYSTRPYNQDEVINVFEKYGFQTIYSDQLLLVEQVRIFFNAECIVGPSGAAWTNILFTRPSTRGLCFIADLPNIQYAAPFSNLAHVFGMDLRYHFEPCNTVNWSNVYYPEKLFEFDTITLSIAASLLFGEETSGLEASVIH